MFFLGKRVIEFFCIFFSVNVVHIRCSRINSSVISLCQLLKGKSAKIGCRPWILVPLQSWPGSWPSPGRVSGDFPIYILGVTGKTGSDIEEQLSICWKSLLCCSAQFYLRIFISERKRRKKIYWNREQLFYFKLRICAEYWVLCPWFMKFDGH